MNDIDICFRNSLLRLVATLGPVGGTWDWFTEGVGYESPYGQSNGLQGFKSELEL